MYPHLQTTGSPSPNYIYSGYEKYYSKGSWVAAIPSSWSTFYPIPPRSSSLPETAINPKVTIHPSQPVLVSDIDTPSSISSHSILTPSSPFAQHDVGEVGFQALDFDEFDYDDEEDFMDSDFADEMEGIDEEPSPIYSASAPNVIKSTSALQGALGDSPSSSCDTDFGVSAPADRRLSASVPGYPSASRRSTAATHYRWTEKTHSPVLVPETSYPSHTYTQRSYSSSTSSFPQTSPSLYNHMSSSSSLAGAFASSVASLHPSRPTSNHSLPILQPQPIRPIPPIPLADLTSRANDIGSPEPRTRAPHPSRTLSPLPLLCQPVSDAVRYQLKEPPTRGALGDICYDEENASESMCEDFITTTENGQFAQQGSTLCQEHQEKLYSCGCVDLPIRWQ
ncbi:hypothetical protein J3R82DRAFT_387 [Butyriboletus roseoflavus]|nr:hypothetical protein J3R82DRAFT_387 [Butyriboletus roseoflavus]